MQVRPELMTVVNYLGFSTYALTTAKKQIKGDNSLFEMEAVVDWQTLITLIEPDYLRASKKMVGFRTHLL